MEIEISELELNEIEKILPDLAAWLSAHTVHFSTSAVILSAVADTLNNLRNQMAETEVEG